MISFIIIGCNEGERLTNCIQSVYATIKQNELKAYEVIYVDSKSEDDSIERSKRFPNIKIFQLTGDINAAIARNIGAKESKGEVLFFIDGDMEIIPEFLPQIHDKQNGLKNNFVSGDFENYYYNNEGEYLYKKKQFNLSKDIIQVTTGGLFLIKKEIWVSVNGMKTKFKVNEDLDLGLRLSKKGIKLIRKKELLAKHHTISYKDANRMWKDFFKGSKFYSVVLLRDHICNTNELKNYFRNNYTSILLFILIIISLYIHSLFILLVYLFAVFSRSIINMRKNLLLVPSRFVFFIMRDISLWIALAFFHPKEMTNIKYQNIKLKSDNY